MLVRDALIPNPLVVRSTTTVLEFIEAVLNSNQTNAAVVDNDALLGVLSASDVFKAILPHYVSLDERLADVMSSTYFEEKFEHFKNLPVRDIMSTTVDTLPPEASVMTAIAMFVQHNRKTLPVVDHGRFVGSVTRRSVLLMVTRRASR